MAAVRLSSAPISQSLVVVLAAKLQQHSSGSGRLLCCVRIEAHVASCAQRFVSVCVLLCCLFDCGGGSGRSDGSFQIVCVCGGRKMY
jgi:hypothetical protein